MAFLDFICTFKKHYIISFIIGFIIFEMISNAIDDKHGYLAKIFICFYIGIIFFVSNKECFKWNLENKKQQDQMLLASLRDTDSSTNSSIDSSIDSSTNSSTDSKKIVKKIDSVET